MISSRLFKHFVTHLSNILRVIPGELNEGQFWGGAKTRFITTSYFVISNHLKLNLDALLSTGCLFRLVISTRQRFQLLESEENLNDKLFTFLMLN